jgi:hypothetical protein
MPPPAYSTGPTAQFRCVEHVLVWPANATVTAAQVEQFGEQYGTDLATLVSAGKLEPVGPEHPEPPAANG